MSDDVVVGVRSALPVPGITFILGNDLAGGNVWGESNVAAPPIVVSVPRKTDVEIHKEFSDLFPACAVTRSMTKCLSENQDDKVLLNDTFFSANAGESESDVSKCSEQKDLKVCSLPSSDKEESTELQSESEVIFTSENICTDLSNVDDCSLTSLLQISREELLEHNRLMIYLSFYSLQQGPTGSLIFLHCISLKMAFFVGRGSCIRI